MKQSIIGGVLLAMPAAGLAQAITFEVDGEALPGETVTIRMVIGFAAEDYAVHGMLTSLLVNEAQGELLNPRLVRPMDGPGTTAGMVVPTGVDGILAGQVQSPSSGIFADPANPIAFWEAEFSVNDVLSGPVILDAQTLTSRFEVYPDLDSFFTESRIDDLEEGSLRIVVPAPMSAAVLLGGFSLTARRRR